MIEINAQIEGGRGSKTLLYICMCMCVFILEAQVYYDNKNQILNSLHSVLDLKLNESAGEDKVVVWATKCRLLFLL